jgi:TatD DNase family protein
MLRHPKTVAVGEVGLDFHWDYSTPEQQKVALLDQLELARRAEKPVVFHARDAYPQLLDILETRERLPYLFHCFAGTQEDARRAINLDAMFGVDGPVTYKNAGDLRHTLSQIPADRLVIETDSPYLSPVPHRGKPNTPAYVVHVNAALAQVLGITAEECAEQTTLNAEKFFRLSSR